MKKIILFAAFTALFQIVFAQYCGNSGPTQCTAATSLPQVGLYPMEDSLPPFENNVNSSSVIQFKNFNVVYFNGSTFVIDSLRIFSIDNLPNGLCWASNKASNTFANSETGCIRVNGTPCDSTGQYKLKIFATVFIGGSGLTVDADPYDLGFRLRLKNPTDTVRPIDTTQTAANSFIPYGDTCIIAPPPVINLGADQSVCNGSNVTLAPGITDGQPPFSFSWQSIGDAVTCDSCRNTNVQLTQNSTFILTITDNNNNVGTDTIVYTVIGGGGNFQVSPGGTLDICQGNPLTLSAAQNIGFTNQWQRDGIDIQGEVDGTYIVTDSSGIYSVVYNSGSCTATSNSVAVTVNESPSVSVTPTGSVSICQGSNVSLDATANLQVTYLWNYNGTNLGSATNPTYTAQIGGSYYVVVTTTANCTDTSNTVVVTVNPLPSVTFTGIPDTICYGGGPITLSGGAPLGGTYSGLGVSNGIFTPTVSGTGVHTITYTFEDVNTCSKTDTEKVAVIICLGVAETEVEHKFLIYPNPANDKLTIQSELLNSDKVSLAILDVTGKEHRVSCKHHNNMVLVNTSNLAKGAYTIKLGIGAREIIKKFIKID